MKTLVSEWLLGKVPILNGIIEVQGRVHLIQPCDPPREIPMVLNRELDTEIESMTNIDWTNALPCQVVSDPAIGYTAIVGECGMGADGFVAVQSGIERDSLLWLAFFDFSNPFEAAQFKDGQLLVRNNLQEEWAFDLSEPWNIQIRACDPSGTNA